VPDAPGAKPDVPIGGTGGGATNVGGTSGSGGAPGTGGSINPSSDASADLPADVPASTGGVSSVGGTGGTGGTTVSGGSTATGGTTISGGTTGTGGTSNTGGTTGAGGTTNLPDAAADLNTGTPDATTAPGQTVALFHFDGTQGSRVLTDSSGTNKVATITGNPVISTAQSKFGGASLYVDGDGNSHTNYVRADGGSDFLFPGDFTVDWWQYVVKYTNVWGNFVSLIVPGDENTCSSCVGLAWNSSGANIHSIRYPSDSVTAPSSNFWHHIALTRSASTFRVFADGVLVATDFGITGTIGGVLGITGASSNSDDGDFNGYIDELRVVNGVAVWKSNFTPPAAPYTSTDILPPDGGAPDAPVIPDAATGGDTGLCSNPHLAAYWTMDESTGPRADSSGNGLALQEHSGTITSVAGQFGQAAHLTGTAFFELPAATFNGSALDISTPPNITVVSWVRFNGTVGGEILGVVRHCVEAQYQYRVTSAGNIECSMGLSGAIIVAGAVSADQWHHYAMVYDGTTMTLYFDGAVISTASWTTSAIKPANFGTNIPLCVGGWQDVNNECLGGGDAFQITGDVDDVAVFSSALNASQIAAIMAQGVRAQCGL